MILPILVDKEINAIKSFDDAEEREIEDFDQIKRRLIDCLGDMKGTKDYTLKELINNYHILHLRLFRSHNKGKNPDERALSPLGVLEEYCEVYDSEDSCLRKSLYAPTEFNDVFLHNSFNIAIDFLGRYYNRCHRILSDIPIQSKTENLNNNDAIKKIKEGVYEVENEWHI